jgi:hypothetical protein
VVVTVDPNGDALGRRRPHAEADETVRPHSCPEP